jgi:hypothetical protein
VSLSSYEDILENIFFIIKHYLQTVNRHLRLDQNDYFNKIFFLEIFFSIEFIIDQIKIDIFVEMILLDNFVKIDAYE